jgi:hypothetical protein
MLSQMQQTYRDAICESIALSQGELIGLFPPLDRLAPAGGGSVFLKVTREVTISGYPAVPKGTWFQQI